jgi:hypothetical protein
LDALQTKFLHSPQSAGTTQPNQVSLGGTTFGSNDGSSGGNHQTLTQGIGGVNLTVDLTSVDPLINGLTPSGKGSGTGAGSQTTSPSASIGSALGNLDGNGKPDLKDLLADHHSLPKH